MAANAEKLAKGSNDLERQLSGVEQIEDLLASRRKTMGADTSDMGLAFFTNNDIVSISDIAAKDGLTLDRAFIRFFRAGVEKGDNDGKDAADKVLALYGPEETAKMLVSDLNELVIDNLKKEECKPLGLTFKWLDRKGYVEYLSHNPALGVEVTCTMMERGHRIQAERLALALKKGERK